MTCKECGKEMAITMDEPFGTVYYCNICKITIEVNYDEKTAP
jgi:hypothetical protein